MMPRRSLRRTVVGLRRRSKARPRPAVPAFSLVSAFSSAHFDHADLVAVFFEHELGRPFGLLDVEPVGDENETVVVAGAAGGFAGYLDKLVE